MFGDEAALLGIVDKRQAMHVVTSQPTIAGEAATIDAIVQFMATLGFRELPHVALGRLGALSFLREHDGIAAFDCHAANFLRSEGNVFPIDVLLVRSSAELLSALSPAR